MELNSTNPKAIKRFTTLEKDFNRIHDDTYDYSNFIYEGMHKPSTILCKTHGVFLQKPSNHLNGSRCPKCSNESNSGQYTTEPKENVIDKFIAVHGDRYDYSKVNYIKSRQKVEIICNEHGSFWQTPKAHNQGQNCPECGRLAVSAKKKGINHAGGWSYTNWEQQGLKSKRFIGFYIYILECWNDSERFYKIGKTFRPISDRYTGNVGLPYEWKLIYKEEGSSRHISNLEKEIHTNLKDYKYCPTIEFRGQTECFNTDTPIKQCIKTLATFG